MRTQNIHSDSAAAAEVDLFDVLAARVRAGEPIHVAGPLDEVQGQLHVALVNRLRRETGLPVQVLHS
jgi:hypothetical protein